MSDHGHGGGSANGTTSPGSSGKFGWVWIIGLIIGACLLARSCKPQEHAGTQAPVVTSSSYTSDISLVKVGGGTETVSPPASTNWVPITLPPKDDSSNAKWVEAHAPPSYFYCQLPGWEKKMRIQYEAGDGTWHDGPVPVLIGERYQSATTEGISFPAFRFSPSSTCDS